MVNYPFNDFDPELYNLFYYYSIQGLSNSSPLIRTHSLKILNEITPANPIPILNCIPKFKLLLKDGWWEVQTQILIISSNLLLFITKQLQACNDDVSQNNS